MSLESARDPAQTALLSSRKSEGNIHNISTGISCATKDARKRYSKNKSMTEPLPFQITTLPTPLATTNADPHSTRLAVKLRELRLKSLKASPEAFASTYEIEKERSLDQTLDRLTNPSATHFIATRTAASIHQARHDDEQLLRDEWLGMLVLLGPVEDTSKAVSADTDPFNRMTSADREREMLAVCAPTPSPANTVLHYHLNGMFVDPSVRGSGLGGLLIAAALREAGGQAGGLEAGVRVTISAYGHNVAARRSYEKVGFRVVWERASSTHPDRVVVDMEIFLGAAN